MKKSLKWVLVIVTIGVLTSFVEKNRLATGLEVGDIAPDFCLPQVDTTSDLDLSDLRGQHVVLSFWASYDATSRVRNIALARAIQRNHADADVRLVSVSFDEYASVFTETVSQDGLNPNCCYAETTGTRSAIYQRYRLRDGMTNYLLDERGVIVAKNIDIDHIGDYLD